MKAVSALLQLLVCLPIWFYLLYKILVLVNGTELMFFLFWIYVPVQLLTSLLWKVATDD